MRALRAAEERWGIAVRVSTLMLTGVSGILAMGLCVAVAQEEVGGAFPGAQGFGAGARGASGGQVIWVTNLESDGRGSLREALNTEGPRIVKFRVAGTIELKRDLIRIGWPFRSRWLEKTRAREDPGPNPYSYVTVEGGSAPPPGITISGNVHIGYGTSHVVLRHLRIRDNGYVGRSGSDCICITDGCRHIMVDHCSLEWARDEVVNPWGECSDITFQWCIFQGYGPHGYGPLNGAGSDRITMHHCLFAHNMGRNPRIGGNVGRLEDRTFLNPNPIIDVRNNLIYNWHNVGCTAVDFAAFVNLVGNYYVAGPSSDPKRICISVAGDSRLHLAGNISPNRPANDLDEWADAGHHGRDERGNYAAIPGPWEHGLRAEEPFPAAPVTTHTAEEARDLVLALVGAWPRDAIDAGIMRTVLDGTGWAGVPNTIPEDLANQRPTAAASAEGTGTWVTLSAEASDRDGEVISYAWDLGDGQVVMGESVTHDYPAPGEYTAALLAMDDRGMTALTRLKLTVADGRPVASEPAAPPEGEHIARQPAGGEPPATAEVARLAAQLPAEKFPPADAWQTAVPLSPFVFQHNWRQVPDEEMDARLLHDGARLYLRIISDDPRPQEIRQPHAGAERWFYRCMEVCLAPTWGTEPWFHYIVNVNGELHEGRMFDRAWDPPEPWQVESRAEGNRWYLEIAIPFSGFGVDSAGPGSSCALKLARYRAKDEILIWPLEGSEAEGQYVTQSCEPIGYAQLLLE